jgi:hypothetical protein
MDRQMTNYVDAVKRVILDYAEYTPSTDDIITEIVMDEDRGHYEVIEVGWQGNRRIHSSIIHIDIIDGKVWLQHDATNLVIADALVEAGIPQESLVLGFRHPRVRQFTDFAVA